VQAVPHLHQPFCKVCAVLGACIALLIAVFMKFIMLTQSGTVDDHHVAVSNRSMYLLYWFGLCAITQRTVHIFA
jgi:hypothetical protein